MNLIWRSWLHLTDPTWLDDTAYRSISHLELELQDCEKWGDTYVCTLSNVLCKRLVEKRVVGLFKQEIIIQEQCKWRVVTPEDVAL